MLNGVSGYENHIEYICLKPSIGQIHLVTAIQAEPD